MKFSHAIFALSNFSSFVRSWGRWGDILSHGRFKRPLRERDIETICRALLAYCLLHYRGDENIKSFIWDLITPTEDGQSRTLTNHSGRMPIWNQSKNCIISFLCLVCEEADADNDITVVFRTVCSSAPGA